MMAHIRYIVCTTSPWLTQLLVLRKNYVGAMEGAYDGHGFSRVIKVIKQHTWPGSVGIS